MKRFIGWGFVLLLLAGLVGGFVSLRPDRALKSGAGLIAHHACAAAFIQGVDPETVFQELTRPMLGDFAAVAAYEVDRQANTTRGSLFGLIATRAQWTQGYGCRLLYGPGGVSPEPAPLSPPPSGDGFAPAELVEAQDPTLTAALEALFTEPENGLRQVKAAVIVKGGQVIAERYAEGYGIDTPLLSYSVAKSFTNAFLGILVRQEKLAVDEPLGASEWSDPGDPRADITLEDLLRMRSGIDATETGTGFDRPTWMLYAEDDQAGYAARLPLKDPVASVWEYSSVNTQLLARRLSETVGGGPAGFRAFAESELFAPLGMHGVSLHFDGAGTLQGSGHLYAPARAYARFGLLYLNDGIAPDGRRILPEGWVADSKRQTLDSAYGSGFWIVDGEDPRAQRLRALGFPAGGFYASGNRGQRIYIVPSHDLVMARFGYTHLAEWDVEADMAVLRAALASPPVAPHNAED